MKITVEQLMNDITQFMTTDGVRKNYIGEFNDDSLRNRLFNLTKTALQAYLGANQAEYLGCTIICNNTNNDEFSDSVNIDVHYGVTREETHHFRMQINTRTGTAQSTFL